MQKTFLITGSTDGIDVADRSLMADVESLADAVAERHAELVVLINDSRSFES